MTGLVLVLHTLPIPIPPKNAGIGLIPILMPVLGATLTIIMKILEACGQGWEFRN